MEKHIADWICIRGPVSMRHKLQSTSGLKAAEQNSVRETFARRM
jgi:hypothetical protein